MGIVVGGGLVLFLLTRRAQDALDARSYPDDDTPDVPGGTASGATARPEELPRTMAPRARPR